MNEASTRELFARYIVPSYGRFDVVFVRGEGARVWDDRGKEYLDFGAGIAVAVLGHSHPAMVEALRRQAQTLIHTSNLYYNEPQARLACKLVKLVEEPGKIFFSNSGAEANEALVKVARKFGHETGGDHPARYEMLTFQKSFHGRTMAGISATAQDKVKEGFAPLLPGFRHLPFNDLGAVAQAIGPETAAILVEPVQGEGGINLAAPAFLRGLRELCDKHDLLLFFDEIQCGLGRLGHWCGWRTIAPEVVPDGISWAKAIAGGFPLGATWFRDKPVVRADGTKTSLSDLLGPGTHGTTYGGTPLASAVALTVLETIEQQDLLARATRLGAIAKGLFQSPGVTEIRGLGLMLGIQLDPRWAHLAEKGKTHAQTVVARLLINGLLTVPAGPEVIRLLPPLTISEIDLERAAAIFRRTLVEMAA